MIYKKQPPTYVCMFRHVIISACIAALYIRHLFRQIPKIPLNEKSTGKKNELLIDKSSFF